MLLIIMLFIKAEKTESVNYLFTYWGDLGQELSFTPISDILFFYPPNVTISVNKSECPPMLPYIRARSGMYLVN